MEDCAANIESPPQCIVRNPPQQSIPLRVKTAQSRGPESWASLFSDTLFETYVTSRENFSSLDCDSTDGVSNYHGSDCTSIYNSTDRTSSICDLDEVQSRDHDFNETQTHDFGGVKWAIEDASPESQSEPLSIFKCTFCPERFTKPDDLHSHHRTHTSLRRYNCWICDRYFTCILSLRRHALFHQSAKFTCGGTLPSGSSWGCGQIFTRLYNLRNHIEKAGCKHAKDSMSAEAVSRDGPDTVEQEVTSSGFALQMQKSAIPPNAGTHTKLTATAPAVPTISKLPVLIPDDPSSETNITAFTEARAELRRLRRDIDDLDDDSEDSSDASRADSNTSSDGCYRLHRNVDQDCIGGMQECEDSTPQEHRSTSESHSNEEVSQGSSTSPEGRHTYKRSHPDTSNEDLNRADVSLGRKRMRPPHMRFICCFHNGPGRKCSGTDDTISEAIRKLAEQHGTHVCDRCWTVKTTHEEPGIVHGVSCRDYCLSPQCFETTPGIAHRHEFDQKTCQRKTSRVRPADSEAIFRYIYAQVHPTLDIPADVFTPERAGHLDSVPRQSRRKPKRQELSERLDLLEKRLEEGDKQNSASAIRINELESKLATALSTIVELEKQKRRIVNMLSDALRTGTFADRVGHSSLLERTKEDAPAALNFEQQLAWTPPSSNDGLLSNMSNTGDGAGRSDGCQICNDFSADAQPFGLEHSSTDNSVAEVYPQYVGNAVLDDLFPELMPGY